MTDTKTLIVIEGPTSVGKTAFAIRLALHFSTEIISADSRQLFKEMSIGTAKPSSAELQLIRHHFISSHSIFKPYSVADFEKEALETLGSVFSCHPVAIVAGGSGLYVRALCEGMDEFPDADPSLRENLNRDFSENGITFLQNLLLEKDPVYAAEVDMQNPRRIIRALEVCISSGIPFSRLRQGIKAKRPFRIIRMALNISREELYDRINIRVDNMMEAGLLAETEQLFPYRNLTALQTVGYTELFAYLEGKTTLEQAVEKIKMNTRRYAKRQLTWLRKTEHLQWFRPDETDSAIRFAEAFL